jgi:hypothetical protein
MAWGDEGVTKLLYKQDSTSNWGPINAPVTTQLIKSGILRTLRILTQGATLTFAGATSASPMGPYNIYSDLSLLGNAQQTIYKATGIGAYYIDALKRALEYDDGPANASLASTINVTDPDYVFDGRAVVAPATNPNWNWSLKLWTSQPIRSLGGDVGLIPMSTENAQVTFSFTENAFSVTGTTYTIQSATNDLSEPYYGANAVTIANPNVDIIKELYEPVLNEADFPDFSFINQWVEERPQTFGTNGLVWKQNQDAGVLLRLIVGLWTSASPFGITSANLNRSDALVLGYNTDIVKFRESALEALARQREQLGFDLDYGVFYYDLLGKDLTLADVLNSYIVPAIQLNLNTSAGVTLNTVVPPKVIAQRLMPIRVQ